MLALICLNHLDPYFRITHTQICVYVWPVLTSEKSYESGLQPIWQHAQHIEHMFTRIHPIVSLGPLIKQEWPAEGNDPLQRCQDNLSSANYFNLEPGGPQTIHTACFDEYIGAPPTRTLLWVPYACNGFLMVSNYFPSKGPHQTLRWLHCPGGNFSLHFLCWALKVRWREIVDSCKVTLRSRNASFDMLKPFWPIFRITHTSMCICMTWAHLRKIIRIPFPAYMTLCSTYRTHVHPDSSHSISSSNDQTGVASRKQWHIAEVPRQLVIS